MKRTSLVIVILVMLLTTSCSKQNQICTYQDISNWWDDTRSIMNIYDENTAEDNEASYYAQMKVSTPICMERMQELQVQAFYYLWNAYAEINKGNLEDGQKYYDLYDETFNLLIIESDRLESEYHSIDK
jgi:hypothetical protein